MISYQVWQMCRLKLRYRGAWTSKWFNLQHHQTFCQQVQIFCKYLSKVKSLGYHQISYRNTHFHQLGRLKYSKCTFWCGPTDNRSTWVSFTCDRKTRFWWHYCAQLQTCWGCDSETQRQCILNPADHWLAERSQICLRPCSKWLAGCRLVSLQ